MVNPKKVEIVEQLTEEIEESRDLVITDYKGLTVEETETLRQELYEHGSRFRVVKNRLAKRALNNVYGGSGDGTTPSEPEETAPDADLELEDISGVGPSKVEALEEEGFETVQSVAEAEVDALSEVSGVGEATAEKFQEGAASLIEESTPADEETRSDESAETDGEDRGLLEGLNDYFKGTTAIALSGNGYVNVAEVLVEFAEEHEDLEIKGGLLNGGILDPGEVENVSELPSRRELLTSLASVLQKPIQKLAYNLQYPIQELVQSLEQIKDEKESSS